MEICQNTVLADPVLCIFYKAESAHLASPLLTLLAPSSFFVCVLAVTNSILQSCGEERKPVISMFCGAASGSYSLNHFPEGVSKDWKLIVEVLDEPGAEMRIKITRG